MVKICSTIWIASLAFASAEVLPVFKIQAPVNLDLNQTSYTVPLSDLFTTEEIDDQVVRFVAEYNDGSGVITKNLDMALFSSATPLTRTNFLQYVSDDDYLDSFIHRSVPDFVIQGGGFKFVTTNGSTSISAVPTDTPVSNEPGISNTLGTIAMAKTGDDPDSATSQWFISTGANSANLDVQNGGFTVFARITKETLPNALLFNNPSEFPVYNINSNLGLPLDAPFSQTPLHDSAIDLLISKFITLRSVGLVPLPPGQAGTDTNLTHAISDPTDSNVASAEINESDLVLSPNTDFGTTSVSITATDSVGNEVIGSLRIHVGTGYSTWAAANFSETDLSNDAISGYQADSDGDGITNLQAYAQGLDPGEDSQFTSELKSSTVEFTYLEQIDSINTSITIERSTSLANDWIEATATEISRTPTAKANRQLVTVSVPKGGNTAFYRLKFQFIQ